MPIPTAIIEIDRFIPSPPLQRFIFLIPGLLQPRVEPDLAILPMSIPPEPVAGFRSLDISRTGIKVNSSAMIPPARAGPDGRWWIEKPAPVGRTPGRSMERWTPGVVFIRSWQPYHDLDSKFTMWKFVAVFSDDARRTDSDVSS
jgi:hypothetical protein